jgi:Ni2+-binding GTPase involved in maturation of urease and hydrogenase
MSIRFVMLGGFLGAGKTTAIARLARAYMARGQKIGIVTNDQAPDLVDTHSLRAQGFDVGEVPGSCFCCNFNALTDAVQSLSRDNLPDVVLAEPVGSCTDLAATVIRPLAQLHGGRFSIAPYGVILKPSHGERILSGKGKAGFSSKADYIFRKQLEEADFAIVNRCDELPAERTSELVAMLETQFPGRPVLRASARTGEGFDAVLETLDQTGDFGRRAIDLDYDIYTEGEAELGWLNGAADATSDAPFDLDSLLTGIVDAFRIRLATHGAETAHLKTIGMCDGGYGVANLVSSWTPAELSLPSRCTTKSAQLIVNARVAIDPVILETEMRSAVLGACGAADVLVRFGETRSFRPGRPVPTHRLQNV